MRSAGHSASSCLLAKPIASREEEVASTNIEGCDRKTVSVPDPKGFST